MCKLLPLTFTAEFDTILKQSELAAYEAAALRNGSGLTPSAGVPPLGPSASTSGSQQISTHANAVVVHSQNSEQQQQHQQFTSAVPLTATNGSNPFIGNSILMIPFLFDFFFTIIGVFCLRFCRN